MNLQFFRLDKSETPLPTSPAAVFELLKPVAFFCQYMYGFEERLTTSGPKWTYPIIGANQARNKDA